MGSNDQFLRWNTHTKTLVEGVRAAHSSDKYADVTLVAEGEFFPAHRVILGVCSDYFDTLFSYADVPKPFVLLDQPARHVRALLNYIYEGEVQISSDDMNSFFAVAQFLKVRGLFVDTDESFSLVNQLVAPPPHPHAQPSLDENVKFQENLRLSLAQADYLSTKYRPKPIPSATIASPGAGSSITTTASPNAVNFGVTHPFSLDVVTNQLFGGANSGVRGSLNAFHLKPIIDGKTSPSLRSTPPPLKRKRTHTASDSDQQPLQFKAKTAKTRSNPRVSPVNTLPAPAAAATTTVASSASTTTTALSAELLLDQLESHAKLHSEGASGDHVMERPASRGSLSAKTSSSAAAADSEAAGSADTTDPASSDAFVIPHVKVEMVESPDEQDQLQLELQQDPCEDMDTNLEAKTEPEDSDDPRDLLVDDDDAAAEAGEEGGHEGRSSSSSSSQEGTEGGFSADAAPAGSSVQDFLQAELQHQQDDDDDGSGDDMPALVMNVDAVEDNDLQCKDCGMVLANQNLLRRHLNDKHKQVRKHGCEYCKKSFKRKEHLDRHHRIHTGDKPFCCDICDVRFTQKEHLKGHVENVHQKLGKKSARNKAKKTGNTTISPRIQPKKTNKLTNGTSQGSSGNMYSIALVNNEGTSSGSNNLHNGGLLDRMVGGDASGSGIIGESMSATLSNALNLFVASQAITNNSDMDEQQQQQQRLALICSSSGNSSSPPQLTSPPSLTQAPSHPLHSTSSSSLVQHSSQFRSIARPYAGSILPSQGLVSILTLPNINNGGTGGPPTTSFMPFNPIPLSAKNIITSLSNTAYHTNLPNTRFSTSAPSLDNSSDDIPSISISNDNGSSPSESSESPVSSVKQITVVAGASGHVEAVVSPTRSSRRGRGRGRGGLGRGASTITLPFGRGSSAGAKTALENTRRLIGVLSGAAAAAAAASGSSSVNTAAKEVVESVSAVAEEETTVPASGSSADKNSSSSQQLTAVYAPVTRNSVSSPEKHMKTVVLNIP